MSIRRQFVSQVMRDLVGAGLVRATVGRNGGYRLGRPREQISLLDVIEAVEGDARRRTCVLRSTRCGTDGFCSVHEVFARAQEALLEQLSSSTLASWARSSIQAAPTAISVLEPG